MMAMRAPLASRDAAAPEGGIGACSHTGLVLVQKHKVEVPEARSDIFHPAAGRVPNSYRTMW